MPNWVYNTMNVSGTEEAMKAFYDDMALTVSIYPDTTFSFNQVIQMPVELIGTQSPRQPTVEQTMKDAEKYGWSDSVLQTVLERSLTAEQEAALDALTVKYGYSDWYYWSIHNWGVKWDAVHVVVTRKDPTEFCVNFDTAWSIPGKWLKAFVAKYPALRVNLIVSFEMDESTVEFEVKELYGLPQVNYSIVQKISKSSGWHPVADLDTESLELI